MAIVTRQTPEGLLMHKQHRAAQPRPPRLDRRQWPEGEFTPIARAGAQDARSQLQREVDAVMIATGPTFERLRKDNGFVQNAWRSNVLHAGALKVTVVLNPAEVAAVPVVDGVPRVTVTINAAGRQLAATVSMKSLRKAQKVIRDLGAESVAVILQGKLEAGSIIEAGLTVQPKQPRVAVAAEPQPKAEPAFLR
jgi:hypothetical protein